MKFEEAMVYSDMNNDLKLLKMISSQEMSSQGCSLMTPSLEVNQRSFWCFILGFSNVQLPVLECNPYFIFFQFIGYFFFNFSFL